jgi:hypothetical protein
VLFLLKIVEIIKRRIINARLIPAIIEPIIVNQFLEDGGSFIGPVNRLILAGVKIGKYWIIHPLVFI